MLRPFKSRVKSGDWEPEQGDGCLQGGLREGQDH